MHDLETRMLLRHYLEMGTPKAELSRRFGGVPEELLFDQMRAAARSLPGRPSSGCSAPRSRCATTAA